MTTPAYVSSFARVIQEAYENAGYLAVGQRPSSEQLARGMNKLNSLVTFLQTRGLKLFTWADVTLTLSNTNFYPIGPGQSGLNTARPFEVRDSYFLSAAGQRVPLTEQSWSDWIRLPINSSSPGQPVNIFIDRQSSFFGVYLWPTPDTTAQTGTVHLILQQQAAKGVSITDALTFPEEWFFCLMWSLADELAIGRPASIQQKCAERRKFYMDEAEAFDTENAAVRFTVDTSGGAHGSEFR